MVVITAMLTVSRMAVTVMLTSEASPPSPSEVGAPIIPVSLVVQLKLIGAAGIFGAVHIDVLSRS